jgi:hypothetical protein
LPRPVEISGNVLSLKETIPVSLVREALRSSAFQFKLAMLVFALANAAVFHWRFGRALKTGAPIAGAQTLAAVSLASRSIAYL